MNKVSLHMVPRVLTEEQKETSVWICTDWFEADAADDIFSRVVIGNESWVYKYDLAKKWSTMTCLRPDESGFQKVRCIKLKIKIVVMMFFDCRGILLIEWTPQGMSVTRDSFVNTMHLLRDRIHKKWLD